MGDVRSISHCLDYRPSIPFLLDLPLLVGFQRASSLSGKHVLLYTQGPENQIGNQGYIQEPDDEDK